MSLFNWRNDKKQASAEPACVESVSSAHGLPSAPAAPPHSSLHRHWQAIAADGITASQFIEFLQPFADLDGISVSYVYNDLDGKERVYNRRRDDTTVDNPLTEAIRQKKISRDEAVKLALNEEGRVWIESNFIDLK